MLKAKTMAIVVNGKVAREIPMNESKVQSLVEGLQSIDYKVQVLDNGTKLYISNGKVILSYDSELSVLLLHTKEFNEAKAIKETTKDQIGLLQAYSILKQLNRLGFNWQVKYDKMCNKHEYYVTNAEGYQFTIISEENGVYKLNKNNYTSAKAVLL